MGTGYTLFSSMSENMLPRRTLSRPLGKTFDDDRELCSVQKNVAGVKMAEDGSAYVHWVHSASIFVFVEHAENNSRIFKISHDHIDRRHVFHHIASTACSPEI